MKKTEDHLFDELIGALEAMAREVPDEPARPGPRNAAMASAISSWRRGRKLVQRKRHGLQRSMRAGRASAVNGASVLAGRARMAVAAMASVRIVVRMIALFVIAGALTLFLVTRPFTSGSADARMPGDAASVVAQTHTELERVTLRGVDQPAWTAPQRSLLPEQPPVEPLSTRVEDAPSRTAGLDVRYVPTERITIDPFTTDSLPVQTETPQPQAATAPEPMTAPVAPPAERGSSDPAAQQMYERGLALSQRNDTAGARLLFKRAADGGHAAAAFALGESYDPVLHDNRYGIGTDAELARRYYRLARKLGADEATGRLDSLNAAR